MQIDHILVLPGGAYDDHAPYEAEPIVDWLQSRGVAASVLRYPVRMAHPEPLRAVRQRIQELRQAGARTVGVLGFSAGAHAAGLAAYAPTHEIAGVPDVVVLAYPVVPMKHDAHELSRLRLLGKDPSDELVEATSLERLVQPNSTPAFFWHTAEDETVPASHSYRFGIALASAGVPHEGHVFQEGAHGLALAEGTPAEPWASMALAWIARLGSTDGHDAPSGTDIADYIPNIEES